MKDINIFSGSCHIATLANNNEQAFEHYAHITDKDFEGVKSLKCTIDYPLKKSFTFRIKLDAFHLAGYISLNVNDIAVQVANKYLSIWNDLENYFDGHSIGDLWIEKMDIVCNDKDDWRLEVTMGS